MTNISEWFAVRLVKLRAMDEWREAVSVTEAEHPGGGIVIDIDGEHVISQFIVWPSRAMEATALAITDGERFYFDVVDNVYDQELAERWERFVDAITRVENG